METHEILFGLPENLVINIYIGFSEHKKGRNKRVLISSHPGHPLIDRGCSEIIRYTIRFAGSAAA